jgi:hypothetical protein
MTGRAAFAVLAGWLVFAAAPAALALDAAPEIFSVTPNDGAAGDMVRITGRHLSDTRGVLFVVGRTSKAAEVEITSDRELAVTVPDYFLADEQATLVVITSKGATVGLPPSTVRVDGTRLRYPAGAQFFHVLKGGLLPTANAVTLVEKEGVLTTAGAAGLVLVKDGGLLTNYHNAAGIVLHEPGAKFGANFTLNMANTDEPFVRRVPVPAISASLGIEPFLFRAAEQAQGEPTGPPRVQNITPWLGTSSDVVTLSGKGFLGTAEVWFSKGQGARDAFVPVGFQVSSDTKMRVVVPDVPTPPAAEYLIVLVNPRGATVTLPPIYRGRIGNINRNGFVWQEPDHLRKSSGGELYWVEGGDRVDSGSSGLVFVKNGGQYASLSAGQLFFEPDAVVPEQLKQAKQAHGVPEIVKSQVPNLFTMLDKADAAMERARTDSMNSLLQVKRAKKARGERRRRPAKR